MSKRVSAKHKICRRQVAPVCGSPNCPVHTKNYIPGQHGPTGLRGRVLSDYGRQLRAKQQLRKYYTNITEKQFRKIYKEAIRRKGDTGENLVGILESRLASVVYRANLAPTMFAVRQLINHGHVLVNGSKVNIPSYELKIGDVVEIKQKSQTMNMVVEATSTLERDIPEYLEVDIKKFSAKLLRLPVLDDVPYPVVMEPHLVIEYYSR